MGCMNCTISHLIVCNCMTPAKRLQLTGTFKMAAGWTN